MNAKTIFQNLGLTVVETAGGVYHLRRGEGQEGPIGEVVGLLYADAPLTMETRIVKLFLQDVEGVPAARIMYHWQTLDARRFEETGLEPVEVAVQPSQLDAALLAQRFMRPDGARVRHGVKLVTGEVVCYN